MKKSLVTLALFAAVILAANGPLPQTAAAQGAPPQQKREIKDSAEYNAYVTALNQQDPGAKVQAFEAFLQQYPNSVVKEDALELLMRTYLQLGNAAKTLETAERLLQVNPNNVTGLALLANAKRGAAQAGQNPQQNLAEAKQYAERGLSALQNYQKPEGMSDADFQKQKQTLDGVLRGARGLAALQEKDYSRAQADLKAAVEVTPTEFSLVYPLALAYLTAQPPDDVNGLFFVARAVNLAPEQLKKQIGDFGRSRYRRYHGSDEGWTELLNQVQSNPTPPVGFTIKPAPSPSEQAKILADQKDPKKMDFEEWELVLSQGDPAVQERVWSQLKGIKLKFAAKVVSATRTTLSLAATAAAIQANQPDVEVTMATPFPAARVPKAGSDIQVIAAFDSYTSKPFLMKMTEGQLYGQKAEPAPKKTPPRRSTTRRPSQ